MSAPTEGGVVSQGIYSAFGRDGAIFVPDDRVKASAVPIAREEMSVEKAIRGRNYHGCLNHRLDGNRNEAL